MKASRWKRDVTFLPTGALVIIFGVTFAIGWVFSSIARGCQSAIYSLRFWSEK